MAQTTVEKETNTWPELAIGIYDKLTGRNSEIRYEFEDMEIGVPASTAQNAPQAKWTLNGSVKITTRDNGK